MLSGCWWKPDLVSICWSLVQLCGFYTIPADRVLVLNVNTSTDTSTTFTTHISAAITAYRPTNTLIIYSLHYIWCFNFIWNFSFLNHLRLNWQFNCFHLLFFKWHFSCFQCLNLNWRLDYLQSLNLNRIYTSTDFNCFWLLHFACTHPFQCFNFN